MAKKVIVRHVLPFLLVLVTLFQFVSCSLEGSYIKDKVTDIKDSVVDTSSLWFGIAVEHTKDWWNSTSAMGSELLNQANTKFHEISRELSNKSSEVLDSLVTRMAQGIYNNAQKKFEGGLTVSDKTFVETLGYSEKDPNYDYDAASFAYKMIACMFPEGYEVFPATLYNTEGQEIAGLAYSDFSSKRQDSEKTYYAAGFVSADAEIPVTEADLNAFLEIYRADGYDGGTESFFLGYLPESYTSHCVALGKYFVFGVNENAQIEYTYEDCNANCTYRSDLGELYSFDTDSIIAYNGTPSLFTESPTYASLRYYGRSVEEIKAELYGYFDGYKIDLSSLDIGTIFTSSKETAARVFSKYQITNDIANLSIKDLAGVDLVSNNVHANSTTREKAIVGTACVVAALSTIACAALARDNPALAHTLGAVTGVAVEVFVEVVLQNTSVSDLNYIKIGIAAISGALSARLGIVGDSLVGGLTDGLYAALDGESFGEILKSIATGAVAGLVLGVSFKGLSAALSYGTQKISSKLARKTSGAMSDAVVASADDKVTYAARKATRNCASGKAALDYAKEFNDCLPTGSAYKYVDASGNALNSKTINGYLTLSDDASDALRKAWTDVNGTPVKQIKLTNATIDYDEIKRATVAPDGFSGNRNNNIKLADYALIDEWKTKREIPTWANKWVDEYLTPNGKTVHDLNKKDIEEMRHILGLTWHETSKKTLNLVPTLAHNASSGGAGHAGAISIYNKAALYNANPDRVFSYIKRYQLYVPAK